jgi:biopolymer transport protein TolR
MGLSSMNQDDKKKLDFDLNLVPFIDMFSVVLCFLIMTAVQVSVGAIDLKQSTGATSLTSDQTPVLVLSLSENSLELQLKNSKADLRTSISKNSANFKQEATKLVQSIKARDEKLNSAIVLSAQKVPYQQIVTMLEVLKAQGFGQVGISSL